eukprot:2770737-Prymnesium_polylepis.1
MRRAGTTFRSSHKRPPTPLHCGQQNDDDATDHAHSPRSPSYSPALGLARAPATPADSLRFSLGWLLDSRNKEYRIIAL